MKAYLINLDRSKDRLEYMRAEFAGVGLTFVRVAGVDGKTLEPSEVERFAAGGLSHPPCVLHGELGCFRSHFRAWECVAAGADDWGAIFEDDVHLALDAKKLLESDAWIPPQADIVRLEANRPMRLHRGAAIAGTSERRVHRAISGTWGAAGYILSRRAARMLIETPQKLHTSVDVFLFKPKKTPVARQLRRYQVVPAVCVQDGVREGRHVRMPSLIRSSLTRSRTYREAIHPVLRLWPCQRNAVPFRP